ncbi:MAG TPA: hypothetical protein VJN18_14545, partial [Polyangiaceae bacterium]|nr:hypothetical protein [Polyangiaceae bacterium]
MTTFRTTSSLISFRWARRAALLLGLAGLFGCNKSEAAPSSASKDGASSAKQPVTLLNVSYDPTRELYTDFNA